MFQAQNRETKLVLEKLLCPPRSLWRRACQDCISQHKTCKTKTKTFFWSQICLVLRPTVSDHITGLGERCELPMWFGAEPWPPTDFFTIFSTQGGLSRHYNIVLLWIKNEKFLTRSILSQYCAFWWCCLIFFQYMRLNSQSEYGKWWSSLQGRGEVDGGGEFDT